MKVAIYGMERHGVLTEVERGIKALGLKPIWRRHDVFDASSIEDFDIVVCNGLRGKYRLINELYTKKGIPVIVTDLGYIDRKAGYHQVGLNRLGFVCPEKCPFDRAKNLTYSLKPRVKGGHKIVILGQMPGDAQHNMGIPELTKMYREWVSILKSTTKKKIIFRPHPIREIDIGNIVDGYDHEENLSLENVHAAVTYNSTAGLDALMQGVPVFCDPQAFYAELANGDTSPGNLDFSDIEEPKFPEKKDLDDLIARISYSQWTREEIGLGEPFKLLLKLINEETLFEEPKPERMKVERKVEESVEEKFKNPKKTTPRASSTRKVADDKS